MLWKYSVVHTNVYSLANMDTQSYDIAQTNLWPRGLGIEGQSAYISLNWASNCSKTRALQTWMETTSEGWTLHWELDTSFLSNTNVCVGDIGEAYTITTKLALLTLVGNFLLIHCHLQPINLAFHSVCVLLKGQQLLFSKTQILFATKMYLTLCEELTSNKGKAFILWCPYPKGLHGSLCTYSIAFMQIAGLFDAVVLLSENFHYHAQLMCRSC